MTKLIRSSTIFIFFFFLLIACVTITAQTRTARVIAENANLRETPSTTGLAEGEVSEGMVVKILDEKLPWYVVRVGDRVGWMHGATLLLSDNATTTSEREPLRAITPTETDSAPEPTRSTEVRGYIRGPRGGCYYISGSGRKVYVDRSMCN
jgi:SH3 domain-containing protein